MIKWAVERGFGKSTLRTTKNDNQIRFMDCGLLERVKENSKRAIDSFMSNLQRQAYK